MNMESRCSRKPRYSDGDNYCPRSHVTKNIARSHDCELFIKVFVGMRKNSVAYRSGKHLVDNVKIRKFKKYIHK